MAFSLASIWPKFCKTVEEQWSRAFLDSWLCDDELLYEFKKIADGIDELSLQQFNRMIESSTTSQATLIPGTEIAFVKAYFSFSKKHNTQRKRCRFYFLSSPGYPLPTVPSSGDEWAPIRLKYEASIEDRYDSNVKSITSTFSTENYETVTEVDGRVVTKGRKTSRTEVKLMRTPEKKDVDENTTRRSPRIRNKRELNFQQEREQAKKKQKRKKGPEVSDFEISMYQLKRAWKQVFPKERYPDEYIVFTDRSKYNFTSFVSQTKTSKVQADPTTKTYNSTTHTAIAKKTLHDFCQKKKYYETMKRSVTYKRCELKTDVSKRFLAAIAAGHPHVSRDTMQVLLAAGRYSLLHDVSVISNVPSPWLSQEGVARSSPSANLLTQWVEDLCVEEVLLARQEMKDKVVFFQTDGGHAGQEVSLFSFYDDKTDSVQEVWTGSAGVGGKSSKAIAEGIQARVRLFLGSAKIEGGLTCDSGQGTPESLLDAADKLGYVGVHAIADSCGLHDIQSMFRLPIAIFVGAGGLQNDTAIQLLHTLYSLYSEFKGIWADLMSYVSERLGHEESEELSHAMQAPIITRWWTIGVLASLFSKHKDVFIKTATLVVEKHKTTEKAHVLASNLLRMCKSEWILGDVYIIAGVINFCINKHMKWFQGMDSNIGKPGFLSVHRLIRYFLIAEDINSMENDWRTDDRFNCYRILYDSLTSEDKAKKDKQRKLFFTGMRTQLQKHNNRLLKGIGLLRSVFGEATSSIVIAKFIQGVSLTEDEETPIDSSVHKCTIDRKRLHQFLSQNVSQESLEELRQNQRYKFHSSNEHLKNIVDGVDIWNDNSHLAIDIRSIVKRFYSAHCSTQHNNERLINLASRSIGGGRSDKATNYLFVAACSYMPSSHVLDEDEKESNEINRRKRRNSRGISKLVHICNRNEQRLRERSKLISQIGTRKYNEDAALVRKQLNASESVKKKKQGSLVNQLLVNFDKEFTPSKRMLNPQGTIIQPIINGFVSYFKFFKVKFHDEIRSEFEARGICATFDQIYNDNKKSYVSKLKEFMKKDERRRYSEELDSKLNELGAAYNSNMTIKQKQALLLSANTRADNSVYTIDTNKYFKQVSMSYDALTILYADGNLPS